MPIKRVGSMFGYCPKCQDGEIFAENYVGRYGVGYRILEPFYTKSGKHSTRFVRTVYYCM